MDTGRRIELQERVIAILARAISPDQDTQSGLIENAKKQALQEMGAQPERIPVPNSYPVGGHEAVQREDL
jgi:hypothetical protein